MKTIVVTGAGGYIGCILVQSLLERGYRVIALDRFYFGRDTLDAVKGNDNLVILQKDIRDVRAADFNGVEAVCDLAALSNDPSGEIAPELTLSINHEGRAHICRVAKQAGVPRYILSSSCSVYGTGESLNLTEDSPTRPISTYARANHAAEVDTLALADDRFSVTVLRNATVFGLSARMRFDLAVNIMTLHASERGVITIMGGGRQWRPFVHVRDVARAFVTVTEAPTTLVNREIFNVGLSNLQIRTVAFIVRETLPIAVTVTTAPDDPDRRDYNVSFEKAKRVLGFTAEVPVEDGVREIYNALKFGQVEASEKTSTVKWYRHILDAQTLLKEIEIDGRVLALLCCVTAQTGI